VEWEQISELELMDGLYKIYKKVTPAIKEMIRGREVKTPDAIYRLRMRGGEGPEPPSIKNPALQTR
jgi:hypothetical protein